MQYVVGRGGSGINAWKGSVQNALVKANAAGIEAWQSQLLAFTLTQLSRLFHPSKSGDRSVSFSEFLLFAYLRPK